MTDFVSLLVSFIIGIAAGIFFFAGLWWTVRKGIAARSPALFFLTSFLARFGLVGVLIFTFRQHWQWLALGTGGFFIARAVLMRCVTKAVKRLAPTGVPNAPQS